jgi:hypothetical protein
MGIRSSEERRQQAVHRLETDANVWIATADGDGTPHLVPLSLGWDGRRVLVATPTSSPTVRNATASGRARLALDSADDVVILDVGVEAVDFAAAERGLTEVFVSRVGWDPRDELGAWTLLVLTPRTVLAWRDVFEIAGRTIMRDGAWVG